MHVTRALEAPAYQAPGHHQMSMHRIQGLEASPLNGVWAARLTLAPGGRVDPKGSPAAKLYLVTEGRVRFRGGEQTVVLAPGDSVFVLPHEEREFSEADGAQAVMYLTMLEHYRST
jgi:quercetin dioxygenase-like cupin family protein